MSTFKVIQNNTKKKYRAFFALIRKAHSWIKQPRRNILQIVKKQLRKKPSNIFLYLTKQNSALSSYDKHT